MREYSVPATTVVGDAENLVDAVYDNADRYPDAVVYRRRGADGGWSDVTAAQFAAEVTAVAAGSIAAGVGPATGSACCPAPATSGRWSTTPSSPSAAVTVPIYETSSADQVAWILSDSGPVAVVVESAKHRRARRRGVRLAARAARRSGRSRPRPAAGRGRRRRARSRSAPTRRRARCTRGGAPSGADDLATLIYTSGTTGRPKGCELTHRNLLTEIRTAADVLPELLTAGGSVLLFLPLAHVFGKVIQCGALHTRTVVGHTPDVQEPRRRPAGVRADVPARRAAGVREGLQRRPAARARRRQGPDLRPRRRRPRSRGARRATPAAPGCCCGCGTRCSTGSSTASCARSSGARCVAAVSGSAPLGTGSGTSSAASGCRSRGLRAHRDLRGGHRQHPRRPADRDRRAAGARLRGADRRRRRDPARGTDAVPRLLEEPDGDRGGGAGAAGSTAATSASSTTPASSRSPAGRRRSSSPRAGRTWRPRCSRTGCARTRSSASAWWSATRSRSSRRW